MNPIAHKLTGHAVARLAERRTANSLPQLEAADAVWVTHDLVALLQPLYLPGATTEQLATWFADWLPEIEVKLPRSIL